MFEHPHKTLLWSLLLIAVTTAPGAAQQPQSPPEANTGLECDGQYACIEQQPLSAADAARSYPYPRPAQPEPTDRLATAQATSAPSAAER